MRLKSLLAYSFQQELGEATGSRVSKWQHMFPKTWVFPLRFSQIFNSSHPLHSSFLFSLVFSCGKYSVNFVFFFSSDSHPYFTTWPAFGLLSVTLDFFFCWIWDVWAMRALSFPDLQQKHGVLICFPRPAPSCSPAPDFARLRLWRRDPKALTMPVFSLSSF